jgi:hypothetical protein
MPLFGSGHEVVTSTTRPASPAVGQLIYQTDTDEYLKYVSYGGDNRWMQADVKSNRRLNYNGNFSVWQRGGATITTSGTYLADRYQTNQVNSTSRSTDVPSNSGFPYSISFGNSSTSYSNVSHKIEASNAARAIGKRITISFWAKNVTGSVPIYVDFVNPTAVDNWNVVNIWDSSIGTVVVPTSTWTYYTFTSSVVAPASVANGLGFFIPRNNGAATTLVTGIQLEVGTAPSEFEFEPYEDTLRKCQRYYYVVFNGSGGNNPALFRGNSPTIGNTYFFTFSLPVTPRTANFVIAYPQPGNQIHKPNVRWDTANSIGINASPGNDTRFEFTCTPGVDDGSTFYVCYLYGVSIILNGEL